jgi:hypothetical protein
MMRILEWLTKRKIDALKLELIGLNAQIDSDHTIAMACGRVFPRARAVQAKQKAILIERIRRLEQAEPGQQ